jgi:hypothetical protein
MEARYAFVAPFVEILLDARWFWATFINDLTFPQYVKLSTPHYVKLSTARSRPHVLEVWAAAAPVYRAMGGSRSRL